MTTSYNPVGNKVWIAAVILCVGVTVSQFRVFATPQNNENNETPFPLELQPPLVDNLQDAIDSYGNPITYSQPIETPDGRKVITAQGVQFEIPNYASGITEIKKPIGNLLPPFIDPNAVAQQTDAYYGTGSHYSAQQQEYTLPDWLADFNDPDVGPGVPYTPSNDANSLKVLSWDLVPPKENDPQGPTSNFGTYQQNKFPVTFSPRQTLPINQGVQMEIHQPRVTTTTIRTTTTTTPRPTTVTTVKTTTTATTTTTTTPSPITTTTEAVSPSNNYSSEIFELPGGNSVVLPSWLQGFDDPELSIAVPFEIPEDNNEYNHTVSSNLLPPLEPFEDLKILSIPDFRPSQVQPVITTTTAAAPTTTPIPIRTTSIKTPLSTFKPFQFQFTTKQPTNSPISFTQKPLFTAIKTTNIPTTTPQVITETPISVRLPQFTLNSSAQPTGFKTNSFMATRPTTVKPTLQPIFNTMSNPFFNSRFGQNGFSSFPKPPTTTPAPTSRESLFGKVTTPSWLADISGVNLGPGVPFSLPSKNEPQQIFNGVLPTTSQVAEQTIDGVTIQKSISSELQPFNFIHNSIPSQSTIPTNQAFIFTSTPLPEPSRLFTPPVAVLPDKDDSVNTDNNLQSQTIPINSYNFPESTEPTTKPTSKVTFNKSDQGKVISNSVFDPVVQLLTKPAFGVSQPASQIGFTSSTLAPGFPGQSSTTGTVFEGKYTGGFGGAPGFLGAKSRPGYAIQPDGTIRDPDHTVRPLGQVAVPALNLQSGINIPSLPNAPTTPKPLGPKRVYNGSFGGPPGILVPFDNV